MSKHGDYNSISVFNTPMYNMTTKIEELEPKHNIEMKWENTTLPSSNPLVWGPSFWFILHNSSAHYPIKASPLCIQRTKAFIHGIPYMLPCESCFNHALAFIEANNSKLDQICSGRGYLFDFFVQFHNYVNERQGKKIYTTEEAYKLYTGNVEIKKMSYE